MTRAATPTPTERREEERIYTNIAKAVDALETLMRPGSKDDRLAAAKALESAACQLRRALKAQE